MKNRSFGFAALLLLFALTAGGQTLEFSSEVYTVAENRGSVMLTVIRSGPASGTVTVKYTTGDFSPGPSSATAGQDYDVRTGTLTFGPSETMKQFTVPIIQDFPSVHEATEVFFVTLSNATGGAAVRAPSTAQVEISDDDFVPEVRFSSAAYSVNEGAGAVVLTLTKTGATNVQAVVYYKTGDWTAIAPSDYTFTGDDLTASVTFEPSETSKEIQIPIADDGFKEGNETFRVYIVYSSHAAPASPSAVDVTITDNDPQGPPEPPAQALNISTRTRVQTGDRVMIGGFIVTGNDSKRVILRSLGPSLANNGVPANQVLFDPVLQLNRADGSVIAANDDWKDDPATQAEIAGSPYQPPDDREAVMVATLPAGAYTASVRGKDSNSGIALVEVYDTSPDADAALARISTRGYVGMETDVMIGGFILGNNPGPTRVAVRGRGPSLTGANLNGVLADPALEVRNANGSVGFSNDDWQSDPDSSAQLTAHGLALPHAKEAGLVVLLPPGQFTAILHGKNTGAGIGLVEIYNLK
jgi:hypothetical protein